MTLEEQLIEDNRRMREVGSNLAIAAMRVIRDYDGVHRLALAVSEWNKAIANEGGRSDLQISKEIPLDLGKFICSNFDT